MALNTLDHPPITNKAASVGMGRRLGSGMIRILAVLGIVLAGYLFGAGANDILSTDQTRGGYEPPYTGFTGEPIQLERIALENDTLVIRGRVLDSEISCRTGMWVFDIVGFDIPYRTVSERALVVHRPQVACRTAGFDTSSWDRGY